MHPPKPHFRSGLACAFGHGFRKVFHGAVAGVKHNQNVCFRVCHFSSMVNRRTPAVTTSGPLEPAAALLTILLVGRLPGTGFLGRMSAEQSGAAIPGRSRLSGGPDHLLSREAWHALVAPETSQ